jgi:hypothetical protein
LKSFLYDRDAYATVTRKTLLPLRTLPSPIPPPWNVMAKDRITSIICGGWYIFLATGKLGNSGEFIDAYASDWEELVYFQCLCI